MAAGPQRHTGRRGEAEEEADHRPAGRHEGQQCHRRSRPRRRRGQRLAAACWCSARAAAARATARGTPVCSLSSHARATKRCADTSVVRRPVGKLLDACHTGPTGSPRAVAVTRSPASAPTDARPRRAPAPIRTASAVATPACSGGPAPRGGSQGPQRPLPGVERAQRTRSRRRGSRPRPAATCRREAKRAAAPTPRAGGHRNTAAAASSASISGTGVTAPRPAASPAVASPGRAPPWHTGEPAPRTGHRQVGPTPTRTRRCVPAESAACATACGAGELRVNRRARETGEGTERLEAGHDAAGAFAWTLQPPSWPVLRAANSSRTSAPRTSPTTRRSGRIRRAWRTRSTRVTSPRPSTLAARPCSRTTCGWSTASSRTSSTRTTRSWAGTSASRPPSRVVLPVPVPR